MSDEKQDGVIFTPKVEEEGRIDEFPTNEETDLTPEEVEALLPKNVELLESDTEIEDVQELDDDSIDDLNKKTYLKISPTLYIKLAGIEKNDDGEDIKLYKILNPETETVEKRELTDEEKREIYIHELKESKIKFRPVQNPVKTVGTRTVVTSIGREKKVKDREVRTNLTVSQFGADYKKKRQRKNKAQRASRRLARKK